VASGFVFIGCELVLRPILTVHFSSTVTLSNLPVKREHRTCSWHELLALLPGQSKAEEFSTLVHEVAREMLHKAERRAATTKTVRETEAEAIASIVGKTIGLATGRASASYIQLYHGSAALLTESLEVIQKTSAVILSALIDSL
jgi:hypothetical protein